MVKQFALYSYSLQMVKQFALYSSINLSNSVAS